MEENYIKIMVESLYKKIGVLDEISRKNEEQTSILKEEMTDWDLFDQNADEKMKLIAQMDELDTGFDQLFEKVKGELEKPSGKEKYKDQIQTMQKLISEITEKSVAIQVVESRNKQLVEQRFRESHQRFGQTRSSGKVAMDYYRNMRQTNVMAPAFLDSKK